MSEAFSAGTKWIDIPRPQPPSNSTVCRLLGVDFDDATLTLRVLGPRMPPFVSGNYVVMRQEEWREMQDAAQGMRLRENAKRSRPKPRSPVAESDAPKGGSS